MVRIFITGSSDGLGLAAARSLIQQGHEVILHARNPKRGEEARVACPGAKGVLVGDLSSIKETQALAEEINQIGRFDTIVHNAGVGYDYPERGQTVDNLPPIFAVNSLAPYILTCLVRKPKRLVYISSGLHNSGDPSMVDITWNEKLWDAFQAYSDSKLHNVLLANAVSRHWNTQVLASSVSPGWVATKMGGDEAPDSLESGIETQVWLAVGEDEAAMPNGKYWFQLKEKVPAKAALDIDLQEEYLKKCSEISGVEFPR